MRWLLALASYAAVALAVVGPPLFQSHVVTGKGIDLSGTLWIHWWVSRTLEEGTLPIWTDLLFYPEGKNFFNDTGANFIDAYLSIPFQAVWGVPDFIDPFNVVIVFLNAVAFQRLALQVNGGHFAAAWAAALVFELNPYVLEQVDQGRPTQALLWFAILATYHLVRLREGTVRDAALFGLYTVLQGLTYWFMVYFIVLALFVAAVAMMVAEPRKVAPRLLLAMGVCAAVASPFVIGIGEQIASGNVTRMEYAGGWAESPVGMASRWRLVATEFVQATWLAVFLAGVWTIRTSWRWMAGFVLVTLFAVGPALDVTRPNLENPFFIALWDHVPFLPRLGFPERIACMGFLLLGIVAAQVLSRMDVVWTGLFAAVALGEVAWRGALPLDIAPYWFNDGVEHIRSEGGAVIALPFGCTEDSMVNQTRHGQPLFGGMGDKEDDIRPKTYTARLDNTFVAMLGGTLNDSASPIGYTPADREAIARDFRWVWLDVRTYPPAWSMQDYDLTGKVRRFIAELGEPVFSDASTILWDLRTPVADPPGLSADAVMADADTRRIYDDFRPPLPDAPTSAPTGPPTPPTPQVSPLPPTSPQLSR